MALMTIFRGKATAMDWQRIAAIGMAISAATVIAFAVFLAWACCKVAGDLDAIEDHERRLRGE